MGPQQCTSVKLMDCIYKICSQSEWNTALATQVFAGSAVDLQDGFIHFSSERQLSETARRHFAGQTDLILLVVDPANLGVDLKWEPSRGGLLFPHLYSTLPTSAVIHAEPLRYDQHGDVVIPQI